MSAARLARNGHEHHILARRAGGFWHGRRQWQLHDSAQASNVFRSSANFESILRYAHQKGLVKASSTRSMRPPA
eukprot:3206127-Alexandrium_andersonii.AAC.1